MHRFLKLGCTFLLILIAWQPGLWAGLELKQISIGYHIFHVEVANTPALREQGLMNRDFLPKNQGMLFLFDKEDVHCFWMKNTRIPLDILWISTNNTIVAIKESATPQDLTIINPGTKAKYALEINGGLAQKYHFQVGQSVFIPPKVIPTVLHATQ